MRTKRGVTSSILTLFMMGLIAACGKQLGDPLDNLTREERRQFDAGRTEFARQFKEADGLGPAFNGAACNDCHESQVQGGAGDEVEVHLGQLTTSGRCQQFEDMGGPIVQQHTIKLLKDASGLDSEIIPPQVRITGRRTTPAVFGLGLLEAVAQETIAALADPDDADGDGISGRMHLLPDGILGRFGRKAATATLAEFNATALLEEQGITSPARPRELLFGAFPLPEGTDLVRDPEISMERLNAVNAYVRFLEPPAAKRLSNEAERGKALFIGIGCAKCHRPALRTGKSEIAALSEVDVWAYTDLLLHDMGPAPADTCAGDATASEFRTEPLMGLRLSLDVETVGARFLHDGRATTIDQAIVLHGGEADSAARAFEQLAPKDRISVVAFLRSL